MPILFDFWRHAEEKRDGVVPRVYCFRARVRVQNRLGGFFGKVDLLRKRYE